MKPVEELFGFEVVESKPDDVNEYFSLINRLHTIESKMQHALINGDEDVFGLLNGLHTDIVKEITMLRKRMFGNEEAKQHVNEVNESFIE